MIRSQIKQRAMIELAKREFFFYCHAKAPDFYKEDREYLVYQCNEMQAFMESDDEVLIINLPPRLGKSRSMSCRVGIEEKQNCQDYDRFLQ